MRTIITFLNNRGLMPGSFYTWQGKEYEGGVFSLALRQFVEHDRMLVCNTPEAQEKTWPELLKLNDNRIEPVLIPKGETTAEMWEMFNTITERVNDGETVIFDITHGLRSLPFLVFLFAAYLKSAKQVQIEAIYYGAFELGKPAPVIDLSEFISIIDWLTATNQFVKTGNGEALAHLLRKGIPSSIELRDNIDARELRNHLDSASKAIEAISSALRLTRPTETMEQATKLEEALKKAEPSINKKAQPFSILTEQVVEEYGQFALEKPRGNSQLVKNLGLQLKMIEWYRDRQQIVQAVTLTREWIVSVLALNFEEEMFDNKNGRSEVEKALNNGGKIQAKKEINEPSRCDEKLKEIPNKEELINYWQQITGLRNDIAHVGMNPQPKQAKQLKESFERIYPFLSQFAESLLSTK
ncbi:TIGR02221 family CRISPR-associated protein [Plectonema cf. radiosum LEGE 06105]|uniref:TIGR02221 family CRISPR-associated protein n=1 Tax=Plectonema cf. radiosum LEGE 06105 TaxID=945769 RepID=A0A8J7F1Y5_9CYAN|nr:TIGR02221 family CRISPR-associated protein [Plectonema radiosum]MBE9214603.1 TIGR02221 family CRISPR-associated protein [Plectonema cf. radiosum LEGE 06105]